jgi:predicted PhzF superfamily epimerase YddE/YHI9
VHIPIYQIDAFTSQRFTGNPAAVCPLEKWLGDETLLAIAAENNLAETAFFVPLDGGYHLRWFTPAVEVKLCGHATLATGHVILNRLQPDLKSVRFRTLSGELTVSRDGERLLMDFPALPITKQHDDPGVVEGALGARPRELLEADRAVAVFESAAEVQNLQPDFGRIAALPFNSIVVTAPGQGNVDFVSRYFAPNFGVPEDPVTGSAHCVLTPYWAQRLGKSKLHARQVSPRGGELWLEALDGRVRLSGNCVPVLEGTLTV